VISFCDNPASLPVDAACMPSAKEACHGEALSGAASAGGAACALESVHFKRDFEPFLAAFCVKIRSEVHENSRLRALPQAA